jgi:hypothetical protein
MIGKPSYKTEFDHQFATIGKGASVTLAECIIIPSNRYGVRPGYYSHSDTVKLLRSAANRPATVRFIADMME